MIKQSTRTINITDYFEINLLTDKRNSIEQILIPSPFVSKVYRDKKSNKLDIKYNVESCPKNYVPSTLGDLYAEIGASKILAISKLFRCFVGVERNELTNYLKNFDISSGYDISEFECYRESWLRRKKINGLEILFPTEKFLINQRVKRRN